MKKTAKNVARDVKPKFCLWQTDFKRGLSHLKGVEAQKTSSIESYEYDIL